MNKKNYYTFAFILVVLLIVGIVYLSNTTKQESPEKFDINKIQELKKIVFTLPNMDKEMCDTFPKRIVTSLESLNGIIDVSFNFDEHSVTAYYDPQFISKNEILEYNIYSWTKVNFVSDESVSVSLAKDLYNNRENDNNPVMPKDGMSDVTPAENQQMRDSQEFPSLVNANWLSENIDNVKIIEIGPSEKYDLGHVNGAVNIQISDIRTVKDGIVEQVLDKASFEKLMKNKGISNNERIVIYSSNSLTHASRLYWTFKYYGHKNVAIVDGGKDLINKNELVTEKTEIKSSVYIAKTNQGIVVDSNYVLTKLNNSKINLLDVRSKAEFDSGHISGAININWNALVNSDGTLKSMMELRSILKNVDGNKEIIVYCVSGTRASYMWFVLTEVLGYQNVKLFDGSMIEWEYKKLPLEK